MAWLVIAAAIAGTCVNTTYDYYSVGGQGLLLVGWYTLPLLVTGAWQAGLWYLGTSAAKKPVIVAVVVVLVVRLRVAALRPNTILQDGYAKGGTVFSADEFAAMNFLRANLPDDAVLLTKAAHHHGNCCAEGHRRPPGVSGILVMSGHLTGGVHRSKRRSPGTH